MKRIGPALALTFVPLVLAQLSAAVAPLSPFSAVLIPFLVTVYPGMLWIRPKTTVDWGYWAMASGATVVLSLAALTAARLAGLHVTSVHGWAFLWGLALIAWCTRRDSLSRFSRGLWHSVRAMALWRKALLVIAWCVACCASQWVVPPQQDQDMVIANPTYGYLQHGKPYGTETHFAYIFSKPPLLHVQAGLTLLLVDRLEQARFYSQSGRIVELLGEPRWATRRFRARDVEGFEMHPELIAGTRLLTTFYATLAPLLLADLACMLGAGAGTAFVGALAFLSIPEVFIRMGYAGFTTPSTVLLALSALLVLGGYPAASRGLAGACLAFLNQKTLFVPAIYAAWRGMTTPRRWVRQVLGDPWLWGIIAGTAVWWGYGALVDWSTFLRDHVYYDFRDRFLFQELSLGPRGPGWYPGIAGLWMEWMRNLSAPFLVLGVGGVLWGLTRPSGARWLALWALCGWILGSVTDWRQTKHLMLTIVPMAVTAQLLVDSMAPRWRRGVAAGCVAVMLYNVVRIVNLWLDFDSISPSTVW